MGMVCCGEEVVYVKDLINILKDFCGETPSFIGNKSLLGPIIEDKLVYEVLSNFCC